MPSLGAKLPSRWYYFEVPFSDSNQQVPAFGTLEAGQPYQEIERFLKLHCIYGERKDLVDRTRIYRVRDTSLGIFKDDPSNLGFKVIEANRKTYTLVENDPTATRGISRDWAPL